MVGVYPRERTDPQRLLVDLTLGLDTRRAAETESLAHTVDYAACARDVAFLLEHGRFRMLETAAHAIARYLLAPPSRGERRARIDEVRVELRKPEALQHRATPRLAIERTSEGVGYVVETKDFGTVDVILETRDVGIYRLNVAPGASIPLHVHRVMEEAELVLTSGLHCQGKPIEAGTAHRWPKEAAHVYENRSERWQSILCIDSPPFLEADEIPTEGAPADVTPEPRWMR